MLSPSRRARVLGLMLGLLVLSLVSFLARQATQMRSHGSPQPGAANPPAAVTQTQDTIAAVSEPAEALVPPVHFQRGALLSIVSRPDFADKLEAKMLTPARRVAYVRLNRELIEGKQSPFWQRSGEGRFTVPLPEGGALTIVVDRSEMLDADRFTSEGHLDGQPASRVIVSYHRSGQLTASIQAASLPSTARLGDTTLHNFAVRATGAAEAQFYEVDESLIPPCGGGVAPVLDGDALAALARRKAADAPQSDGTAAAPVVAADGAPHVTVDLMMLYTQGVDAALPGATVVARAAAVQTQFDNTVALVNSDFARSLITARVRLVKIAEVNLPGDESTASMSGWQSTALTALRQTNDGVMDEIHPLRDQVGADLVCLAINRPDSGCSGIGYVLQHPTQVASDTIGNDLYGFTVVNYGLITSNSVVSHELGHNFGCQHDRENAGGAVGAYSYSYGYRFYGQNGVQYRTIMAYAPGIRLGYFSNPNVTATEPGVGVLVGVPVGQPGEACNALTMEKDAFEVAGFRLQQQTDAGVGTLVSVSTRAYVGTGEQQLIGGFSVAGSQSRQLLVRAAGASLAQYGVSGALADPKLTIVPMPGTSVPAGLILANDNWTNQLNPAAVTAADAGVRAFSLVNYPLDSALVVTLPPGNYSAIVEGVGGATGIALIEAYEVDTPGDTKIVSLSTRGYADIGREMIAGFAVQGNPGETKRILVRVQGPNLGQYGVTGAMPDPCLELHAADGTILIANDDWSEGDTALVNGKGDDFTPVVASYSEQAIAATGLAPKNRREPAVLVDLLPGAYSVVVKPFERLIATSTAPAQLAQPGVAIVEVFEIKR